MRVAPALLMGALAALIVWGAGRLWGVPAPQRGAWLAAAGCWTLAFSWPKAWQTPRHVLTAHAASALALSAFLQATKIMWPAMLPTVWLWVLTGAMLLVVRWFVVRGGPATPSGEAARLLLLLAAGWWACRPLFTANLLGGLDARWYAYTLFDFLEQLRAGVFPVLVGQGPYQFNGAVHPFRFAPYYQYFGGVLDLVSGRGLGGFALQHLTVIASTFGGVAAMYFSLASLAPRFRWTAALVAVSYILCPVWVGLVSFLDMYMSFMAVAWVPVVFCGVARWFQRRDTLASVLVASGLSITWVCHAPVALWASMVSLGILFTGWVAQGLPWRGAVRLGTMLALLAALSAYHLFSIVEVTPPAANAPRAGFGLIWAIIVGSAIVSLLVVRKFFPVTAAKEDAEAKRALWLLVAGVGVLAVAGAAGPWLAAAKDGVVAGTVAYTKIFWPAVLRPVHTPGALFSDVQPGYAIGLLGALGLIAAVLAREARAKLLGIALLVLTCFVLPFSPATATLWSLLPTSVLVGTSGAVNLRLSPVWVTLMAFSGFSGLVWWATWRPRGHQILVGALVALLPWSGWEAYKLTSRLAALEYSAAESENFRRPENATLFIYSGNQIGSPGYFSNGVRDYRLESRVLDPQTYVVSPELAVATPPPAGKEVVFTIKPVGGTWELEPHLILLRDEPWVTQWKFSGGVPDGTLIISSTDIFREYPLPSSGGPKSFGSGPTNSHELPLWTSSPYPEEITFRILPSTPVDPATPPREFARVELRPLDAETLPVRTLSLVPAFHATVEVRAPALLETCRTWAPGYRATRNGREIALVRTPEGLVGVPLAPGPNEIVVRFVGTPWLRRMFFVSLIAWIGMVVWLIARARAKDFLQHLQSSGV